LNREMGLTILLATHSDETAAAAKRIVRMRDGKIVQIEESEKPDEQKQEAAQIAVV
jgi:putative ABC transport system ATP-binding protein